MMKNVRRALAPIAAGAAILLGGCVAVPYYGYDHPGAYYATPPAYANDYGQRNGYDTPSGETWFGTIENIEEVGGATRGYAPSGVGVVLGGLIGGLVGNQFGSGDERAASTALGAVGGALLGNGIEANNNAPRFYRGFRLSIRTDDGAMHAVDVPNPGELRIGDRIRIDDGRISRV